MNIYYHIDAKKNLEEAKKSLDMFLDSKKAFMYAKKALEQGLIEANILLGILYRSLFKIPVNMKRAERNQMAFEAFQTAAQSGIIEGVYYLGIMSMDKKEYNEATRYFNICLAQEYIKAVNEIYKLKMMNKYDIEEEKMNELINRYLETYDDSSMHYEMGLRSLNGIGREPNEKRAFDHIEQAVYLSKFSDEKSINLLIKMYENEIGTKYDEERLKELKDIIDI